MHARRQQCLENPGGLWHAAFILMIIADATPAGQILRTFQLELPAERASIRDIIRARIQQEVAEYNQTCGELFQGLVQPTGAEPTPNGFRMKERRAINEAEQVTRALEAFEDYGFFILAGERQAESLDDVIEIRKDTKMLFVKLMQLVGG
jgi:hypothetical protein